MSLPSYRESPGFSRGEYVKLFRLMKFQRLLSVVRGSEDVRWPPPVGRLVPREEDVAPAAEEPEHLDRGDMRDLEGPRDVARRRPTRELPHGPQHQDPLLVRHSHDGILEKAPNQAKYPAKAKKV